MPDMTQFHDSSHSPAPNSLYPHSPFRSIDEGSRRRVSARKGRDPWVGAPLAEFAMFALFESLLKPTVTPDGPEAPPGDGGDHRRERNESRAVLDADFSRT